MIKYLEGISKKIKPGENYTLYFIYCDSCKKYKRILSNPPMGPGGTLSCPICRERKENGPHIEGAYGCVKSKRFNIILPNDIEVKK